MEMCAEEQQLQRDTFIDAALTLLQFSTTWENSFIRRKHNARLR